MNGTRYRLSAILFLASLAGTVACSSDFGLQPSAAGVYTATELSASVDGDDVDLLQAGAQLTITLTQTGTTSGTLVVPGAFTETGSEETFSLEGTYDYDAETGIVTFDHPADTFIRDVEWTLTATRLHGEFIDGTTTVAATLER